MASLLADVRLQSSTERVTPIDHVPGAYRELGELVAARRRSTGLSVIGVASASRHDGKTTTATRLAATLARARDVRVLLVEADVRRPSIARRLHLRHGPGLLDAIRHAGLTLDQITHPCRPLRANVITAGRRWRSSYEALGSPRLGALLKAARRQYDYVILDAPAVDAVPDFRVISCRADGVFFVVAADRTPRRAVEDAVDVLDPAKLLGFVFHGALPTRAW